MSSRAWVTLATNDSYSLGALVLAHSLRRVSSTYPAVILITPSVTDSMRERLRTAFADVIVVDVLDSQDAAHLALLKRPELGVTFTKIHCWCLIQFEKCVFLDADTLVIQNCDELFEREELSAAPDVGWPDCFNSGVFVYRPSQDTFDAIIKFAKERGSFDGGDQGLLNSYFSSWARADINKHLPFLYNVTSAAFYSYLPALTHFGQDLKIIHFIGTAKPWLQTYNWENNTVDATGHLKDTLQLWWDIFVSSVHPQLDVAMTGVAGNLARVVPGAISSQREALDELTRRQGWEAGNIDYLGADSFDNIWAKISQTLNQSPKLPSPPREAVPAPKEPTPPPKEPSLSLKQPSPPTEQPSSKEQQAKEPSPVKQPSPPKEEFIAKAEVALVESIHTAAPTSNEEKSVAAAAVPPKSQILAPAPGKIETAEPVVPAITSITPSDNASTTSEKESVPTAAEPPQATPAPDELKKAESFVPATPVTESVPAAAEPPKVDPALDEHKKTEPIAAAKPATESVPAAAESPKVDPALDEHKTTEPVAATTPVTESVPAGAEAPKIDSALDEHKKTETIVEAKPVTESVPAAAEPSKSASIPEEHKKPQVVVPATPPVTPSDTASTTPVNETIPAVGMLDPAVEAPASAIEASASVEALKTPEIEAIQTDSEATPEKTLELSVASTDSPPLANTPSKDVSPQQAAKSEGERARKPANKLQLSPPGVGDPLPTPDSELEDAASLAQSIIASELATPTVISPTPPTPHTPASPPPAFQQKRLSVDEPVPVTPPAGPVSLAQIGVKPKPSIAAQIESSITDRVETVTPSDTPATPSEPGTPIEVPKKKLVKKSSKKDAAATAAGAEAPVPPPRKKEKKPKEK